MLSWLKTSRLFVSIAVSLEEFCIMRYPYSNNLCLFIVLFCPFSFCFRTTQRLVCRLLLESSSEQLLLHDRLLIKSIFAISLVTALHAIF